MARSVYCSLLAVFVVSIVLGSIEGHAHRLSLPTSQVREARQTQDADIKIHIVNADECTKTGSCQGPTFFPSSFEGTMLKTHQDLHSMFYPPASFDPTQINEPLCETETRIVFPKRVRNRQDAWVHVVNTTEVLEGIRVETCKNPDGACTDPNDIPAGYKTSCRQTYVYRNLKTVTSDNETIEDRFHFPASCACHVQLETFPYVVSV